MATVWQEMYCPECKIYFGLQFEDSMTGVVGIRCGICLHPHTRYIVKGEIKEDGRYNHGKVVMEVEVLRSACYPVSKANAMMNAFKTAVGWRGMRDGVPISEEIVSVELTDADKAKRQIIMDSWLNKYAREKFG